jgi:PadR family transcriptional regulator PadR
VLGLLSIERAHGYALIENPQTHGFAHVKGGTLYPLLRRLEDQGFVRHVWQHSDSGPGRKVFSLTLQGLAELGNAQAAWRQMSAHLDGLNTQKAAEL